MNVVSLKVRQRSLAALGVIAVLSLAACGSSNDQSSNSSSSAATPQSAASSTAKAPAGGTPSLAELTSKGSETAPPTSGPPPAKGKSVWWVSCGMQIPDCADPANAAKEAAAKLGIDFHIADGKLGVGGGQLTAVRTALAASPDAIIVHGIACASIKAPLEEAKRAGVKTLPVEAFDCPGTKLFTADMKYTEDAQSVEDYFKAWGKNLADNLIALTGGKASILNSHGTFDITEAVDQGFKSELQKCPGCKILNEVDFTQAEEIPNGPYIKRVEVQLTKYPQATAINFGFGANSASLGGAKLAHQTNPKMVVVSGTGLASDVDQVRSGLITAVTAHSSPWIGYAAIDNINRVLKGQPTVPQGVGFRTVTKDANLPDKPGTAYQSPVDFKAAYEKLWSATP